MSIVRVKKKRGAWVTVDKTPFLDKRLTWQAKGLMIYLLSKPDDWTVNIVDLVKQTPDERGQGKDSVKKMLKLLEDTGYVARIQVKDTKGCFASWETIVFETPEDRKAWEGEGNSTDSRFKPPSVEPAPVQASVGSTPPLVINEKDLVINEEKERTHTSKEKNSDSQGWGHGNSSTSSERMDDRYQKKELPAWKASHRKSDYSEKFIEYWLKTYGKKLEASGNPKQTRVDAITWLSRIPFVDGRDAIASAIGKEMNSPDADKPEALLGASRIVTADPSQFAPPSAEALAEIRAFQKSLERKTA